MLQLLSVFSRLFNVMHGGKARETFSERTHRSQDNWYFGAWRKVINGFFRLFGQAEHTLMVHTDEEEKWKRELRLRGYVVQPQRVADTVVSSALVSEINARAQTFEMDQNAMVRLWNKNRKAFVEAAYQVDWPAVVSKYSNATVHKIMGSGTSFNIKGQNRLRKMVADAVTEESAKRAPKPRATNGMVGE